MGPTRRRHFRAPEEARQAQSFPASSPPQSSPVEHTADWVEESERGRAPDFALNEHAKPTTVDAPVGQGSGNLRAGVAVIRGRSCWCSPLPRQNVGFEQSPPWWRKATVALQRRAHRLHMPIEEEVLAPGGLGRPVNWLFRDVIVIRRPRGHVLLVRIRHSPSG